MLMRFLLRRPRMSYRAVSRREFFRQLWPDQWTVRRTDLAESPARAVGFRPPGAVKESEFLKRCVSCGLCAEVCPAKAIKPDPQGLAMMDVNQDPCLACPDVPCSRECSHGALTALDGMWLIKIGSATIHGENCWRTDGLRDCGGLCHDVCPLRDSALKLYPGQAPEISRLVCIGCGQCVRVCPSPGAITVIIE